MGRRFTASQRAAMYLRSRGRCGECGRPLARGWHADHIVPWSRGGKTDAANAQALCPRCNRKKGVKDGSHGSDDDGRH
jgi:5-methylcytosine-specific restriction endonuclease McrA